MPTFSRALEDSLRRAIRIATERTHEYATHEHLLLGLADDKDAIAEMRACNADLDQLKRSLVNYIDNELKSLRSAAGEDAKPTTAFQRVVQRAVIHVQSSGRE